MLLAVALSACQKNPKLETVAVDVYIHPESSSSDDVMLQTAIRGKLDADNLTAGFVQVRRGGPAGGAHRATWGRKRPPTGPKQSRAIPR